MKVKEVIWSLGNDFKAKFECEGCGHIHERTGYNDYYFFDHVVPALDCPKCGKNRIDILEAEVLREGQNNE